MIKINKRKWECRNIRLNQLTHEMALEIFNEEFLQEQEVVVSYQKFPDVDTLDDYLELYGFGKDLKEAVKDVRKKLFDLRWENFVTGKSHKSFGRK
jgi:hypothetical protein